MTVHFAIESDNGFTGRETVPCCGYNFRRQKKLTDDPAEVSCVDCRKLCGFDEQLTECLPDPLRRAA